MLDLDWEVGLFRALRALWRRLLPAPPLPYDPARAQLLEPLLPTLGPLAQLFAEEGVRLQPARSDGRLRGRDILLPPFLDIGPDLACNRELYVLRTVHAATMRRVLRGKTPPQAPLLRFRQELETVETAFRLLSAELLPFSEAWQAACALVLPHRPATLQGRAAAEEALKCRLLRGEGLDGADWDRLAVLPVSGPPSPPVALWGSWLPLLEEGEFSDGSAPPASKGTELIAPPAEELQRVFLDTKLQEEKVLQHSFEKVDTEDTFDGALRPDDGSDELADHAEALEELKLSQLYRGGEHAQSLYRAELRLDAEIPDVGAIAPEERGIPYDEWDFRAKTWKKAWCTVYPSEVPRSNPAWVAETRTRYRHLIDLLRRRLEEHRSERRALARQLEGPEVDLDALVEHLAACEAGRTSPPRIYERPEHHRRDYATLVLMDLSLSSDSWVANRRVLDVTRESVLVLGEVADSLGDRLLLQAFASQTRNRSRVWNLCGPSQSWEHGRGKLGVLEPQGYTRIGPALRHATATLAALPASRKLLLLISDGKPNDYDRYEGRYGIADVHMAIREAEAKGIHTHALAVDAIAKDYLPEMLGQGAWNVLHRPEQLPKLLSTVYGRLTH